MAQQPEKLDHATLLKQAGDRVAPLAVNLEQSLGRDGVLLLLCAAAQALEQREGRAGVADLLRTLAMQLEGGPHFDARTN